MMTPRTMAKVTAIWEGGELARCDQSPPARLPPPGNNSTSARMGSCHSLIARLYGVKAPQTDGQGASFCFMEEDTEVQRR